MAYITTAERIGRTEGLREALAMTLATRFGAASEPLLPALQQFHNPDTLHTLFNRILGSTTLDDVRAAIDEAGQGVE